MARRTNVFAQLVTLALTAALLLCVFPAHIAASSPRGPVIGVFAHPAAKHGEYIAASYVKWIEMGGGRVVPISYTAPKEYIRELVPQLNGLLFPGGAATVNDRAELLFQLALELNDNGTHFPVWATCLGFEWLVQLTTGDLASLNSGLDSMNISLPLNFTAEARTSRLFGSASNEIYQWLADKPLTMNNHEQGISVERFASYPKLVNFYTVLATNYDRQGLHFVSVYEAKTYPVYAVQFHPEKNSFEYGEYVDGMPYEVIDHSYEAIVTMQYFANFFINEARKNALAFNDARTLQKSLIYNFATSTFTAPGFVEAYLFKHDAKRDFWIAK